MKARRGTASLNVKRDSLPAVPVQMTIHATVLQLACKQCQFPITLSACGYKL